MAKLKKLRLKRREALPDPKLTPTQAKYRYKGDLRDKLKATNLIAYRKSRGSKIEFTGATVLRALDTLDLVAETLSVKNAETGSRMKIPAIRVTVLAKLLDTSYQTVWRWTSETEQLPPPVLIDSSQGRDRPVYHVEEARIIIQAVGEHLNQFKYYRKDHVGTKDRIFHQIETLRDSNYGVKANGNQEKGIGQSAGKSGKARKGGR